MSLHSERLRINLQPFGMSPVEEGKQHVRKIWDMVQNLSSFGPINLQKQTTSWISYDVFYQTNETKIKYDWRWMFFRETEPERACCGRPLTVKDFVVSWVGHDELVVGGPVKMCNVAGMSLRTEIKRFDNEKGERKQFYHIIFSY